MKKLKDFYVFLKIHSIFCIIKFSEIIVYRNIYKYVLSLGYYFLVQLESTKHFGEGLQKVRNSSNKISRNSKTIYVAYSIQSCSLGFVDYRNEWCIYKWILIFESLYIKLDDNTLPFCTRYPIHDLTFGMKIVSGLDRITCFI